MKKMKAYKISAWILRICIIIALVIFIPFYIAYLRNPEAVDTIQTDGILTYSFILLGITFLVIFVCVIRDYLKKN